MRQMNLIVTPEFEQDLEVVMQRRGLRNKSEAIRVVVREEARKQAARAGFDWNSLAGAALKPGRLSEGPRTAEDDLWS